MKIKTMSTRAPLKSNVKSARVTKKNNGGAFVSAKRQADWQAEDDARIMSHYQQIMDDPKRKEAAMKKAAELAADLEKRAEAMRNASKGCSDV